MKEVLNKGRERPEGSESLSLFNITLDNGGRRVQTSHGRTRTYGETNGRYDVQLEGEC
jgi:hypothetical protein